MYVYDEFLAQNALPKSYREIAEHNFVPLANRLIQQCVDRNFENQRTVVIGLNGTQGSGKTTLGAFLKDYIESAGLTVLNLSIDDFYLSRADRQNLSQRIHPLLATRGVPGTHNVELMRSVLVQLRARETGILIPRFDKSTDDCVPSEQWEVLDKPVDIVILEGWCWGALHQAEDALIEPINSLEREEDSSGAWRAFANAQLRDFYEPLYQFVDAWLMLKAPSFDCVFQWRLEQENKLAHKVSGKSDSKVMSESDVRRFVDHYERLTRATMDKLGATADWVWHLDKQRNIVDSSVKKGGWFDQ